MRDCKSKRGVALFHVSSAVAKRVFLEAAATFTAISSTRMDLPAPGSPVIAN